MRKSTCLSPDLLRLSLVCAMLTTAAPSTSRAQEFAVGSEATSSEGVIPASYQGSGSFFNRQLGTAFRLNYHTEGYGTQDGVVSLGAMKVFNMEGATWFLDGQGTLSDDFGGGFNTGIGYRQLTQTGMSYDPTRIFGGGFWVDGQSTSADNFFTQLGFNLESLGDDYDLRLNGHFPLKRTRRSDSVFAGFTDPTFMGNNLVTESQRTTIDTALTVVDAEAARRINNLEAWGYIAAYHLGGGGNDAAGYRLGVRGYAVPDLALSLQVTDDDIYHTNVMFGVTWFVGRTNSCNGPCGTLLDRFREPVLRNDFIAINQRQVVEPVGDPMTDAVSGDDLRYIHVNSNAGAGGDGTVEKPFMTLAEAEADQTEDDTILVYSGSVLSDNITLLNSVEILGYGNDIIHVVDTAELGLITLPDPFPGASSGAVPIINGVGDVFTLADSNRVNNFVVNSGARAVVADGVDSPELGNLEINGITGDGITLMNVTGTTVVENSVNINNAGGTGLLVDGGFGTTSIAANIVNAVARPMILRNRSGGTFTFSGTIADTGTGLLVEDNSGGTINFTNDLMFDLTGANNGVTLQNNTGTSLSFAGLAIQTDAGTGFTATGGGTLAVTSTGANTISTDTGLGLELKDITIDGNNVTFDSVVVANGAGSGIELQNLDGAGQVIVGDSTGASGSGGSMTTAATAVSIDNAANVSINNVDINNTSASGLSITNQATGSTVSTEGTNITTTTADAVSISANTDGTVNLDNLTTSSTTGDGINADNNGTQSLTLTDVDVTTSAGDGVSVTNSGTLAASGTNDVTTTTGVGVRVADTAIDAGGAVFSTVNVSNGATNAVALQDLAGGLVTIGSGTTAGDGGSMTTAATAVTVDNASNVAVNNVDITNTTGTGLSVTNQAIGSTVSTDGTNITTTTADAVNISNNTAGTVNLSNLTTNSTTTGDGIDADTNNGIQVLNLTDVNVTTDSGDGVKVDTATLSATGTNDVTTTSGVGVQVDNTAIAGGGAGFTTVNVSNGATNAVSLSNLNGGRITIGSTGNASVLTTAGDTIVATNVQQGTLSNVDINSTGGTAVVANNNNAVSYELQLTDVSVASTSAGGVTATHTGVGNFTFGIDGNSNIDQAVSITGTGAGNMSLLFMESTVDTSGTDVAFTLDIGGNVTLATVTMGDNFDITADNATAFDFDANTTAASTVNLTYSASTVANDSASETANIRSEGLADLTTDFSGVTFTNNGSGESLVADHVGDASLTMQADTGSQFTGTVDINSNGTGDLDLIFDNATITTAGNSIGFTLDIGTVVTNADITIQGTNITSADAAALDVNVTSLPASPKTVDFLLDNGTFSNDSATTTVEIDSAGDTTFNANITLMMFDNDGAGVEFDMASNDTASEIDLHFDNNTAVGGGDFVLRNPAGNATTNFEIQDRDTVEARNTGTFNYDSAGNVITEFGDIPGPVPQP